MDRRSLRAALDRWVAAGLIDDDQAAAIAEHEAAIAPPEPPPLAARIGIGAVLAYAGTLVALAAVFALYVTVFQDYTERARVALTFGIAAGAGVLTLIASRFRAGRALADALGLATTLIALWATLELFRAVGWLGGVPPVGAPGYEHALGEMRGSFLGIGLMGLVVGYIAARVLRSPLSAAVSAASLAWCAGVAVWWLADPSHNAPGVPGGQAIVIVGDAIALLAIVPGVIGVSGLARFWWQLGALAAANVAGFALAINTGGVYEGLLLGYAVGLAAIAILRGGRVFLVVAAVTLYEYVALVIFRTFEGAVGAIVVLALIGLGTAFTGAFGARIGFGWLWHWTGPRTRPVPAPEQPGPTETPPAEVIPAPPGAPPWDEEEQPAEPLEAAEAEDAGDADESGETDRERTEGPTPGAGPGPVPAPPADDVDAGAESTDEGGEPWR